MKILLFVFLMFAFCYAAGFLLTQPDRGDASLIRQFRAHVGYAYFLVSFYVFYVLLKSAFTAIVASLLFLGVFFAVRGQIQKRSGKASGIIAKGGGGRAFSPLLAAVLVIFTLAAWPYLATGWGSYWHNGNYDIEDGLNGRDAYLDQKIFDGEAFSLEAIIGDSTWVDFSKKAGVLTPRAIEKDSYYAWYAGDGFRLQYSNQAFWSFLFHERYGMDMAIVHAVFNLLLMVMGVFSFARLVFQLGNGWSAMAAFSSVSASFYFGTFWAGHIGSLMYGSLAPMLAALLLLSKGKMQWSETTPWIVLVIGALAFTYPQALALGLAYWSGYRIYTSHSVASSVSKVRGWLGRASGGRILAGLVAVVAVGLLLYAAWIFTESYRLRQDGQYRAWGLVHDLGIIPLFFGYIPNAFVLANNAIYTALTVIGAASVLIALACLLAYKGIQARFVHFFMFTWLVGLLFFYLCVRDSYYIFKYLYTHQFVIVVALCAFVAASRKMLIRLAGGGLLAINVASDVAAGNQVFQMPYNGRPSEYARLANLGKTVLNKAFIGLIGGEKIAVRQTLKRYAIETELDPRFAQYFIVRKGTGGDITGEQLGEVVFSTDLFDVRKSPEKNYLMVRTWFEPEVYPVDPLLGSTPYRWIGQGKNDNVGIYVIRPDHTADSALPFLRICGQKGPSATTALTLNIFSGDGKKFEALPLEGTNCAWLPSALVKDAVQPLILRTGAAGIKLRPPEDRTLLYRIFSVAWVSQRYDEKALSLLNPDNDVVRGIGTKSIRLGNGWWPPETFDGEHFRWAADGAEIIVSRQCAGKGKISMNLEIGPAHGKAPAKVLVASGAGEVVSDTKLTAGRQRIEFVAPHDGTYRISTGSERKPLPGDPRILDFRVLGIEASGC